MGKWQERAAALGGDSETCAVSVFSADRRAEPASPIPNGTNGTNGTGLALPVSIEEGLKWLGRMPAPRLRDPSIWPEIVADALRLGTCGWAAQALALGWHPLNLFGVSPARRGLADLEGLAVVLAGRRIVLLDDRSCVIANGPRSRAVFYRRSPDGAVFLWELGRRGNGR